MTCVIISNYRGSSLILVDILSLYYRIGLTVCLSFSINMIALVVIGCLSLAMFEALKKEKILNDKTTSTLRRSLGINTMNMDELKIGMQ